MADVVERYRIVGENAVGAAFKEILNQSRATTRGMQAIFRTAFAGISIASVTAVIKSAVDRADEIKTLAESFGTTTEELSRLDYIAKQSNTTLRDLTSGLTAYQKNVVLAGEDSGRARKAIAALKLDADALVRVPLPRQLGVIADRFREIENPAERVRIAAQLFGDEVGRRMIPILMRGSEGMKELADEADRTGKTLTTFQAQTLQRTDTAFKNLGASADAFKTRLAVGLTPVIEKLVGLLDKLANPDRSAEFRLTAFYLEKNIAIFRTLGLDTSKLEEALQATKTVMESIGKVPPPTEFFDGMTTGAERAKREIEALVVTASKIRLTPMAQLYEDMERATRTSIERQTAEWHQFKVQLDELLAAGVISASEYNARLQEFQDRAIPEVEVTARKIDENIKQIDKLSVYAEQAARNIQSVFADFLFDPFDKGIKGMLRGFIDVLRRMIAEAAAARILEGLEGKMSGILGGLFGGSGGGGGGGLFKLFGGGGGGFKLPPGTVPTVPGFASGGFMPPGSFGMVGERGPELAMAGPRGATIIPFPKERMGAAPVVNVSVVTNVDARGASVELINRLPGILEQNRKAAVDEAEVRFVEGLRRNRYRLG